MTQKELAKQLLKGKQFTAFPKYWRPKNGSMTFGEKPKEKEVMDGNN